jgi:hypothetical protein
LELKSHNTPAHPSLLESSAALLCEILIFQYIAFSSPFSTYISPAGYSKMVSNEVRRLKAGGWLMVGILVVSFEVEISVMPVTTVLVDGVQEVTFAFTSSSSKRNDKYPAERGKSG